MSRALAPGAGFGVMARDRLLAVPALALLVTTAVATLGLGSAPAQPAPGVAVREAMRTVSVGGRHIDPLHEGAPLMTQTGPVVGPREEALAIVQFAGPIKGAWYDALAAAGVRIVWYQPQNAYLVRGTGAQLARAATGPGVRAAILYTAADKLAGAPGGPVAVSMLTGADGAAARAAAGSPQRPTTTADGVSTRYTRLTRVEAAALAQDPGVVAIAPASTPRPLDERAGQIMAGLIDDAFQPVLGTGYLDALDQLGAGTGDDFVVDVTDTGLDTGEPAGPSPDFRDGGDPAAASRIAYARNETLDADARDCLAHGTHVASTVAGYNAGSGPAVEDAEGFNYGLGIAPRARIGSTKVFSCANVWEASRSYTAMVADQYAAGARISNNSWGGAGAGAYDADAREYDALVRDAQPSLPGNQQMVEIFAAGNDGRGGYNTLVSPATAKNVIAVGASEGVRSAPGVTCGSDAEGDSARDIAPFSSRGPTADGRIKPDVVAPGTRIVSALSRSAGLGPAVCDPFPAGSPLYAISRGTSVAAPHVTGAAALLRDWYRRTRGNGTLTPSPAMTKALLVNTATDLVAGDEGRGGPTNPSIPAQSQGWGRVNLTRLFHPVNGTRVLRDQSDLLQDSGEATERTFTVADPARPVRVTLAWTDAPGALSGGSWVNDLDLSVVKDGTLFRGNVFSGGVSASGGAFDFRNNLENVFLPGSAGTFRVTVNAANIAGDGVPGNLDPTDQDYALVVSNALPAPEQSFARDGEIELVDHGDGDGAIEPGERVGLRQRVVNVGDGPADGATATLAGDLAPIEPSVAYPPLDAGASAERELVGRVPTSAACGSSVGAVVTLEQPSRPAQPTAVAVAVGGSAAPVTRSQSHDPPLTIPDDAPAGVSSPIAVPPGAGPVGELKVRIDSLPHQWVGDLRLTLTSPDGRVIVLADRPGPGALGSSGNDLLDVVFDDAATQPIDAIPGVDAPVASGSYRPDQPLGTLAGTDSSGTWTLTVSDHLQQVTGALAEWSLIVRSFQCSNPAGATTGAAAGVSARGATVTGAVDAGGVPTQYRVEYGATAAYGAASTPADAGDGGAAPVAVALSGLAPETTYHYRVVALRDGAVAAAGADAMLTTGSDPVALPGGGGPPSGQPPRAFVSFARTPSSITVGPRRRFTFRFTGTPAAAGTVGFRAGRLNLGSKRFRIASSGRAKVTVKLPARTFATLSRRRRLRATARIAIDGLTFAHRLTLKAPRQRRR